MTFTLPVLAGIMVLHLENDLTQKWAHHISYDIYQDIFYFGHHCYYNHFVLRVDF